MEDNKKNKPKPEEDKAWQDHEENKEDEEAVGTDKEEMPKAEI